MNGSDYQLISTSFQGQNTVILPPHLYFHPLLELVPPKAHNHYFLQA